MLVFLRTWEFLVSGACTRYYFYLPVLGGFVLGVPIRSCFLARLFTCFVRTNRKRVLYFFVVGVFTRALEACRTYF